MTDLEDTTEMGPFIPTLTGWTLPNAGAVAVLGAPRARPVSYDPGGQEVHAVTLRVPVSPLFRAAYNLLAQEDDQLAAMCKLADAFPGTPLSSLRQMVREVAVLLHAEALTR